MGSANDEAGFRWTMGGFPGAIVDGRNDISGVAFNFTMVDILARGLHNAKVDLQIRFISKHKCTLLKVRKSNRISFIHIDWNLVQPINGSILWHTMQFFPQAKVILLYDYVYRFQDPQKLQFLHGY